MYRVLAADLLTDSTALAVVIIYVYTLSILADDSIRTVQIAEEAAVAFISVAYRLFCTKSAVHTYQSMLVGRSKRYVA